MAEKPDLASSLASGIQPLFGKGEEQPTSGGSEGDLASELASGIKFGSPEESAKELDESVDPYEKNVLARMPEARKLAQDRGYLGSLAAGALGRFPIIAPIAAEIEADLTAALPEGYGPVEGATYGERRQNYKAQLEAENRASEELHPVVAGLGEFGSALALPAGRIAKVGEMAGLPAIAALGAEGAAYGAGTAAAEKIGTRPESEQPGIGTSALLGGTLGTALGTLASVAPKAVEKVGGYLPDWAKNIRKVDPAISDDLAAAYAKDEANGFMKVVPGQKEPVKGMSFEDWMAQKKNPDMADPHAFDLGGENLQNKFKEIMANGNPEQLAGMQKFLADRSGESGNRFSDFVNRMYGVNDDMNLDVLKNEAADFRVRLNKENYAAAHAPENGVGTWNPQWNKFLGDEYFQNAVQRTNDEMSYINPSFRSPFETLFRDPETGALVKDFSIEKLPLQENVQLKLMQNGIFNASDFNKLTRDEFRSLFQVTPRYAEDVAEQAAANTRTDAIADRMLRIQKETAPKLAVNPNDINVHYLDMLQRNLNGIGEGRIAVPRGVSFTTGEKVKSMGNKIVQDIAENPESPYFNPAFAKARQGYLYTKDGGSAFTYGQSFLSSLNNTSKVHEIVNEVRQMNGMEKRYFQQGVLLDLLNKVKSGDKLNAKKALGYFDNSQFRKAWIKAFGENELNAMENFVRTEKLMNDSAIKAGMIKPAPGGPGPLMTAADWLIASYSLPMAFLKKGVGLGEDIVRSRYYKKAVQQVNTDDIGAIKAAYDRIYRNNASYEQATDNIAKHWLKSLAEKTTQTGATMIGRKDGGRVAFKDGGKVKRTEVDPRTLKQAQHISHLGRHGDTILAHINPQEAAMLKKMGGSGRINPRTGLLEFSGADPSGSSVSSSNYGGGGGGTSSGGGSSGGGNGGGGVSGGSAAATAARGGDTPGFGTGGGGTVGGGGGYGGTSAGPAGPGTGGSITGGGSTRSLGVIGTSPSLAPGLGFDGAEVMSPLIGTPIMLGQANQQAMLNALGISGSPVPGGLPSSGTQASTGVAPGTTEPAVNSQANMDAVNAAQLAAAADAQAQAQAQIDAQNAAALAMMDSAPRDSAPQDTTTQSDQNIFTQIGNTIMNTFTSENTLGVNVPSTYSGEPPATPTSQSTKEQGAAPGSPSYGLTGQETGLSGFESSLGTTAPAAVGMFTGQGPAESNRASSNDMSGITSQAPAESNRASSNDMSGITSQAPAESNRASSNDPAAANTMPALPSDTSVVTSFDMAKAIADFRANLANVSMLGGFSTLGAFGVNDPSSNNFMSDAQIANSITNALSQNKGLLSVGAMVGASSGITPNTPEGLAAVSAITDNPAVVNLGQYNPNLEGKTMTLNPASWGITTSAVPTPPSRGDVFGTSVASTGGAGGVGSDAVSGGTAGNNSQQITQAPSVRDSSPQTPSTGTQFTQPGFPHTPTPSSAYGGGSTAVAGGDRGAPQQPSNQANPPDAAGGAGGAGPSSAGGGGSGIGGQRPAQRQVAYGANGQILHFFHGQWYDETGNIYTGDVSTTPPSSQVAAYGGAIRFPEGRITRATGGRIPDVDKLFKTAKKELDGHTSQYLRVHDDHVAHHLHERKGLI